MAAYELANLRYTQVDEILKREAKSVALVPSGSTEAHGPHLPLSTDSIISEGMAKVAAEKLAEAGYTRAVLGLMPGNDEVTLPFLDELVKRVEAVR